MKDFYKTQRGMVVLVDETDAVQFQFERAADADVRSYFLADMPIEKIAASNGTPGCGGCGKQAPVHRWMMLRWYGVPMPVRWWRRTGEKYEGCGCLYVLKNLWVATRKYAAAIVLSFR